MEVCGPRTHMSQIVTHVHSADRGVLLLRFFLDLSFPRRARNHRCVPSICFMASSTTTTAGSRFWHPPATVSWPCPWHAAWTPRTGTNKNGTGVSRTLATAVSWDRTQFYHELWDRYLPACSSPSRSYPACATASCIVASMCVPVLFMRNAFAINGGFSDNIPCLHSTCTRTFTQPRTFSSWTSSGCRYVRKLAQMTKLVMSHSRKFLRTE